MQSKILTVGNSNDKPTTTFGSKVLVVTGGRRTTEIIDLENSNFGCTKVGNFPKTWYFANGGVVCGGWLFTFKKSCYALQENGTWKEDEKAKLVRGKRNRISGSAVINNTLFIPEILGDGDVDVYLNFEMAGPSKKPMTLKPFNRYGPFYHLKESCIVNWDANTIMLIGVNSWKKETFFINMGNQTVTEGPKLMEGRYHHACHKMDLGD